MLQERSPEPTSISKAIDNTFDQKMIDLNFKAVAFLGSLLYKPLATASDPFFRKNLGERYFTKPSAALGLMLWVATASLTKMFSSIVVVFLYNLHADLIAQWVERLNLGYGVGLVVCFLYGFTAQLNLNAVHARQMKGVRWYSMSRGESYFKNITPDRENVGAFLLGIILFFIAPPVGLLFITSRILSCHLADREQQSIYARYLDRMDAEIMNEHLEPALDRGGLPKENDGIYGPLPKHFTGDHRTHVAHTAAGGVPARVVAKARKMAGASTDPQSSHLDTTVENMVEHSAPTSPVIARPLTKAPQPSTPTPNESAASKSRPSNYLINIIFWGVVIALTVKGALAIRDQFSRSRNAGNTVEVVANPQPATKVQATTQIIPKPETKTNVADLVSSTQIQQVSSKSTVQESINKVATPPPVVQTKASTSVQTNKPLVPTISPERQKEIERLELAKGLETIARMIKDESTEISRFKANGNEILGEKLRETSFFYTKQRKDIKKTRDTLNNVANNQEAAVREWQNLLPTLSNAPLSLVQRQLGEMKTNALNMSEQRNQMVVEINAAKEPGAKGSSIIQTH